MEFLNQQFTFTISATTLIIGGAILLAGLIGIIVFVIRLLKKLNDAQKPRYGFLGKPLYQFALLTLLLGGIAASVYVSSTGSNLENTAAREQIDIQLEYESIQSIDGQTDLSFEIVPLINNEPWGENQFVDLYINLTGPESYSANIQDSTNLEQTSFVLSLESGEYTIEITAITENGFETYKENITVN